MSRSRSIRWIASVLITSLMLSGCRLIFYKRGADYLDQNFNVVSGKVFSKTGRDKPMVVVLFQDAEEEGGENFLRYSVHHESGAEYFFFVPHGSYALLAFEDTNADLVYQPTEPAALYHDQVRIDIQENMDGLELEIPATATLPIEEAFDLQKPTDNTSLALAHANLGRVLSLEDPLLSLEMGRRGVWRPVEYVRMLTGGVFFLEEYDQGKIPIVFVHGIGGAPIQFEHIIGALDRERFQPWVVCYPSFFPLKVVAEAIHQMMDILQARHGFDEAYLVAHSMGGLVSRAVLNEYLSVDGPRYFKLFVSLASPFDGHSSAESGVEFSPRAVESWKDLVPGSPFLITLFNEELPEELPHYLFFAFQGGMGMMGDEAAGDGTVSLASQLRREAQDQSHRMYGYDETHNGVLENEEVRAKLVEVFDLYAD
jgi:pimeloyl-ACP methyl ester carboxylesterase